MKDRVNALFIYQVKLSSTSVYLKQKSKTLDRYLVKFNHPEQKKPSEMWFSVDDMAAYLGNKLKKLKKVTDTC